MDQLVAMIYGQLTGRTSLRETVLCLHALGAKRYHCGIRRAVARSSLADANESRDWRIFRDTALALIARARGELPTDPELQALDAEIYAFDSTTIVWCLKLFPWARAYKGKAAVKLHTLLDLHTEIPVFITLSDARQHDMEALDTLEARVGAYYVMDRGYVDFARLYRRHQAGAFFVTRAKRHMTFVVRARQPAAGAVRFDQIIRLRGYRSRHHYPDMLRRIGYVDPETGKRLVSLTNNQALSAETIALLYHHRWRIELFFKWIKQNLRIKAFYGRSENAVCVQVWVIVRRRCGCRTTQSGHGFRVYANLAQEVVLWRPHQLLVSDITYLRTLEGFLYLALVMDAYSRKIVGHDCSDSLEAEGARRALRMALRQLPAGAEAMHHSDRGVQYCCGEYIQMLEGAGLAISMTEENHCYENAKAERLNGILKQEYGLGETQATKAGALQLVDQAVGLYNAYRPHTALGYACPSQVHAATVHGAGAACDRSGPGGVMPVAGSLVFLNGGRECNGPAAPRPGARQLGRGT
jgi:transposase InsO family protein